MLYDLGYKSGLEPNTVEISNPAYILTDEVLVSLRVSIGTIIVNGNERGSSTNAVSGDTVEVRATSGSSLGIPRFAQLFQDEELVGTFALINKFDETFEYNDALNGKYAWEVLPDSEWVAQDNSSVVTLSSDSTEPVVQNLTDKKVDKGAVSILRTKYHVLDYYLNKISILDAEGVFVGRIDTDYDGPVDSTTVFSASSEKRIFFAVAFEHSNKIQLLNTAYSEIGTIDVTAPISITSVLNVIYVAHRDSNDLTVITVDDFGSVTSTETLTLIRKPHRLYQVNEYCAVLTETSVDFVLGSTLDHSVSLPAFASSMFYESVLGRLYITHRQERKITIVELDFENNHTILLTSFFQGQGYLDGLAYDRDNETLYVSDIVESELLKLDSSLRVIDRIDLPSHSYELYFNNANSVLIASCLYPDIDERLIVSDGDPDPIDYKSIIDIPVGGTGRSDTYTIDGVRNPVTLYLYPDDSDVEVSVNTEEGSFTNGTVIQPYGEFYFEVSIPGGKARRIDFVLGQHAYSFTASPELKRLIPIDTTWNNNQFAETNTGYISNAIQIHGLDVIECTMELDYGTIYKNGVDVGSSTTVSNGDRVYIAATSHEENCQETFSTVTWGGIFESTWVITTRSEEPRDENKPEARSDFIDIFYAELGSEFISDAIIIDTAEPTLARINDDYNSSIIVNGVDVGQSAAIESGDSVQLKLTTKPVFGTAHQLVLSMCKTSVTWIVTTLPSMSMVPLDFGTIKGVTLGDKLQSEVINLDSVSSEFSVDIIIPRNTIPLINGSVPSEISPDELNYKGVLYEQKSIRVAGGSDIQLVGYALGVYGSTTVHRVVSGISQGSWNIQSLKTTDAIQSRELAPYIDREDAEVIGQSGVSVNHYDAEADVIVAKSFALEREIVPTSLPNMLVEKNLESSIVVPATFDFQYKGANYSKSNRPILDVAKSQAERSSNPSFFIDKFESVKSLHSAYGMDVEYLRSNRSTTTGQEIEYVKGASGIKPYTETDFDRTTSPIAYSVSIDYTKGANTNYLTYRNQEFIRNFAEMPFTEQGEFVTDTDRSDAVTSIDFKKRSVLSLEHEREFRIFTRNDLGFIEYEYGKLTFDMGKFFIQEFSKPNVEAAKAFVVDFNKPISSSVVNLEIDWNKHARAVSTAVHYLKVEVDGVQGLTSNTVNKTVVDNLYNIKYQSGYTLKVDDLESAFIDKPNAVTDYTYHSEVSLFAPTFVSLDTFSYTSLGSRTVTITESDCVALGNENCLDSGYFATENAALANAIGVWGVEGPAVRTYEVSPGCWIWAQKLPCVNSCYGCPSTGYIKGG